ncbi:MAG: hypothetical protein LBL61_06455, partial [Elusimicrobiota bacterium]|nr:hypothetical protein [Elusimicrobiota bacterium]
YSVGGNRNAFADITPQSILEDALKFYLAVKLPGNLQHDNTPKRIRNIQKTVVTPVKDPQEKPQNPANDAKQTADAVSNSPKQSLLNKLDEILKQPGLTPEQMHNFKADRSLLENLPESTADGDAKLLDIKNHIMYPAATDNMYAVGGADLGFIEAQFGPGYRTTHISDGSGAWDSPAKGVSLKQINEAIDAAAGTANLSKDFRMDYMAHGRYALNPATGKWGWFSAVGGDYRYTGDGQWTKARQPSAPPAEGEIISAGDIVNIAAKRQAMTGGEGHIVLGQCNAGTGCQADIIDAYKGLPKGEGKLFVYTQSANNNPHTANWSFMSVEKTAGQSVGDNTYASFVEAIRPDYEIGSQITILDRATGNITRIYPLETALSKASGQMKTDLQRVYNLMEADPRDTEGVNAALKEIGRIEGAYVPQEVLSGKIPAKSFNITSSYGDAQEAADLFMENFNTPLSKDGMVSIYIPDQLFNHVADVAEEMNAVGNKKN